MRSDIDELLQSLNEEESAMVIFARDGLEGLVASLHLSFCASHTSGREVPSRNKPKLEL
jgi:hypothetical protein